MSSTRMSAAALLLTRFHFRSITETTQIYGVAGGSVLHSVSPAMHNAAITELGLDWRYLAFDVHPEDLAEAIRGAWPAVARAGARA